VLSEVCIKRPVFATVLSLIIVLVGLISYQRLTVREYPAIDEPVVSVVTVYKGASPEVVESQVTKPLEDQLAGIEGVDVMTSRSRSERSLINIKFNLSRDPDAAAAEVRDKVSRAPRFLPDEVDGPIIGEVEADSQPIIYIAVEAGPDRRPHHRPGRRGAPDHELDRGGGRRVLRHPGVPVPQPLHQAAAGGAAGGGGGSRFRRAAAVHAHLRGPRQAGRRRPGRAA